MSDTELSVIKFIGENGQVTASGVMEHEQLGERWAQTVLKQLIEKGIVQRSGTARSTRYSLANIDG